jgi:hypothetical protein
MGEVMYAVSEILNKEPVAIAAALKTVLFVAVLFGLAINEQQLAGIAIALEVVLGLFVRSKVTPA